MAEENDEQKKRDKVQSTIGDLTDIGNLLEGVYHLL